jgi:hypothetical protein
LHAQDFTLVVIPFVFHTSLDADQVPFGWEALHSLLEEFLQPYYYNDLWHSKLSALLSAGRIFRTCAMTKIVERKLMQDMLSKVFVYIGHHLSMLCVLGNL